MKTFLIVSAIWIILAFIASVLNYLFFSRINPDYKIKEEEDKDENN